MVSLKSSAYFWSQSAKVTRSIQQDIDLIEHITTSTSDWATYSFDSYGIPHLPWNTTFCVLGGTPGSIIIPFSGNAIFVYGFAWSSIPSRASLDAQDPIILSLNSSLPSDSAGRLFSDNLLFLQFNPSGSPNTLVIDNHNGVGQIGLDYIEIVTVTGGSPHSESQHRATLVAVISVAIIFMVFFCLLLSFVKKCFSNSDGSPPAAGVVNSEMGISPDEVAALIVASENT